MSNSFKLPPQRRILQSPSTPPAHHRGASHWVLLFSLAMIALCAAAPTTHAQGSLVSWGRDNLGQVGGTPVGGGFIAVDAGEFHSVAVRSDGSLVAWGSDNNGQVSGTPIGNNFVAVSAGPLHNTALRLDGSLVSWGADFLGAVSGTPTGNNFVAVSAGVYCSVALRSDGSLVSWGDNGLWGLVSGTPTGTGFTRVSAGYFYNVAIRSDGSLVSWGDNTYGEVSGTPSGNNFVAVSAGSQHGVALRSDGSLVSWGYWPLGAVSGTPTGNSFVAVSAGGQHSTALRSDGSLVSWGWNLYGQVSGTPGGTGFTAISGGSEHGVALGSLLNAAPVVDAGGNQTITLPAEAFLNGTVTDDGRPIPPALTTLWSVGSGPGVVGFQNAVAVGTWASFTTAGTYVIRLTASDGELSTTDSVTIVVVAPPPTPAQQITAVGDGVQALVTGGVLLPSQGNSLLTKLDGALGLLTNGNMQGAISKLGDFIKQVNSFIKTGKLTSAQGQPLIDAAQALIAELQASSLSTTPVSASGPSGRDIATARAVSTSGPDASSPAAGTSPESFRLYPATFDAARGAVTLRFDLPRASDVTLELYDIGGRRIDQLRLGSMGPGRQEWTSARLALPSAMLFYRLRAGDLVATGKVPFVR